MKQLTNLVLLLAIFLFAQSCSLESIDAGEEAVLVYQPYFFGSGGIDKTPIKTGSVWLAASTSIIRVNVKPYQREETFDDLTTGDNTLVDFNTYIKFQQLAGKTPELIETWGTDWYENNIQEPYHTFVRNEAKPQLVFALVANADTITAMQIRLQHQVSDLINQLGIPVECVSVTIGKVSPPEEVIQETIRTAAQKQRFKTEEERAKAELARKQAEINKAAADNAYRNQFGMSVPQYLQLRQIEVAEKQNEIFRDKADKGTFIMNFGATPVFGLPN